MKMFPTREFLIVLLTRRYSDFDFELEEVIFGMKRQVLKRILPFISFMHGIGKKRGHNMPTLMLDPKYKSMCVVITYLGHEIITSLVINYDEQLLVLLLLEVNYKVK